MDLRLSRSTACNYVSCLRAFLSENEFTPQGIREFLSGVENPNTFNNWLKAFTAYARFTGSELKFKFKRPDPPLRKLPTKKELQEFYSELDAQHERLAFVGFAVTGLRRRELLNIRMDQIDAGKRAIFPNHSSLTKRTYITFYNDEFEDELTVWLKLRSRSSSPNSRLFSVSGGDLSCLFRIAHQKTGLHITPQTLRFWFANEMARLGVPDRFIDAFQGRIPRSVLARHYTDYSPQRLKEIYDRAGLKVLG